MSAPRPEHYGLLHIDGSPVWGAAATTSTCTTAGSPQVNVGPSIIARTKTSQKGETRPLGQRRNPMIEIRDKSEIRKGNAPKRPYLIGEMHRGTFVITPVSNFPPFLIQICLEFRISSFPPDALPQRIIDRCITQQGRHHLARPPTRPYRASSAALRVSSSEILLWLLPLLAAEICKGVAQWITGDTKQPLKRLEQFHHQEDRT